MEFEKNINAFFVADRIQTNTRKIFFRIKRDSSVCVDEFVFIAQCALKISIFKRHLFSLKHHRSSVNTLFIKICVRITF